MSIPQRPGTSPLAPAVPAIQDGIFVLIPGSIFRKVKEEAPLRRASKGVGIMAAFHQSNERLKRFFQWFTRRAFQDLQSRDWEVADYLSDLLARFARTEQMHRFRDREGRHLESVVEVLLEVEEVSGDPYKQRETFQQLGDYLLFMAGLFREYVQAKGFLGYYLIEGPRAYRKVWEVEKGLFSPSAKLFERLFRGFEFHAGALHYMRKTFFHEPSHDDPVGSWRRQVISLLN